MTRNENGVNFTLFETEYGNGNDMYSIQLNTDFNNQNWEACGQRIISTPAAETETLELHLFVRAGNSSHIAHDFELGIFPNTLDKWKLEIKYVDAQDNTIKDVKTEQAEGEAEPRPIKEGTLG